MSELLNSTESKTESNNSGYAGEVKPPVETKVEDTGTDDYGYSTEGDKKPEEETKAPVETKAEEKEEVIKPATGYKEEEVKPEEEKKSEEKEATPDEEKIKLELTNTVKELPEGYDQDKIVDFALKNKLTNDQVKAYVEMEKVSREAFLADQEKAKAEQTKNFIHELKSDVTFGGENFDRNIMKVEKIIEKHFPNMKKVLTDRGGIVPPYIMKDFLSLDKILNPTASLVAGEAIPSAPKETSNFLDDMYK